MIRELIWKYKEWRHGEDTYRYFMDIRNHPRAHDENFDRYSAIVYVVSAAYKLGLIVEDDRGIVVSDKGTHVIIPTKVKNIKKLLEIQERVR